MANENTTPTHPHYLTPKELSSLARWGEADKATKARLEKEFYAAQKKATRQAEFLANAPKMPVWPEGMSALPNAMARSKICTVGNRNTERSYLSGVKLPVAGPGEIRFRGQELRQDDKQLLLHLIDQFRAAHGGTQLISGTDFEIETTANKLIKSMGWARSGRVAVKKNGEKTGKFKGGTMGRFFDVLDRLQTSQIVIFTSESDAFSDPNRDGIAIIPRYSYTPRKLTVRMSAEFFIILAKGYTLISLEAHKSLPSALARWIHTYVLTHKKETPISLNTLIKYAGMKAPKSADDRASRRCAIRAAISALQKQEILTSDSVLESDIFTYRRHTNATKSPAKIEAEKCRISLVFEAKGSVEASAADIYDKGSKAILVNVDSNHIDLTELASTWRELVTDAVKVVDSQEKPDATPVLAALNEAWDVLIGERREDGAISRKAPPGDCISAYSVDDFAGEISNEFELQAVIISPRE